MRGKALHMYGVFGLAPNLSVNNDQKKVCRSRRSEPLLLTERPEVPSTSVDLSPVQRDHAQTGAK